MDALTEEEEEGTVAQAADEETLGGEEIASAAGQYNWSAFYDDEGRIYYYNSTTEESSWDAPAEGFNAAPEPEAVGGLVEPVTEGSERATAATASWVVYKDEEGREYYYNVETEETQWEKPDGNIALGPEEPDEMDTETGDAVSEHAALVDESKSIETAGSVAVARTTDEEKAKSGSREGPTVEAVSPVDLETDPAVKRVQDADAALNQPDSIMEPSCIANVTELVTSEGGNPQKAIAALIDNFVGQTAICGLLGRWLADLRANTLSKPSPETADEIRTVATNVVHNVVKERFSKAKGDSILDLSKAEAAFLEDMMDSPRWRHLLIDLSATHKDSAVLTYCLRAISKRGHHREIARRVNQSDHFSVFNAMLSSELAVIGTLAISAESETGSSIGLSEIVDDLRRACTSTSYTYLYSLEVLRHLKFKAQQEFNGNSLSRFCRAIRKWEVLGQSLESTMMDPASLESASGSSPLFRKRRLDVAIVISGLHQRQRKRKQNKSAAETNGKIRDPCAQLETALANFLRRYANGIQVDDAILDSLLPVGLDLDGGEIFGKLVIKYPLAIQALLGYLFKPGPTRVVAPVVKNKCAKLLALACLEAEKAAFQEIDDAVSVSEFDEVTLTRMILEGAQLCEQLETMVSFLVAGEVKPGVVPSPGQKLCSLAFRCSSVAQGVSLWALEFTSGPEFAASASFPTLSVSVLSLIRLLAIQQPFTRRYALEIALAFLRHSNRDISYQKITAIREQSLRLLIVLVVQGQFVPVMESIAKRLQQERGDSDLDASLVRYFVSGVLEVVRSPVSKSFARSLGGILLAPRCIDAIRSSYFKEESRTQLRTLLIALKEMHLSGKDGSLVNTLLKSYGIE
jgi:hypothetical protein